MTDDELFKAHEASIKHESQLKASTICGCFYCRRTFSPDRVKEWITEGNHRERTALCPYCGIDSVIGSASDYPITAEFITAMRRRWFR